VAVGIVPAEDAEPSDVQRRFSEDGDIRDDPQALRSVGEFIDRFDIRTVVMTIASSAVRTRKPSTTRSASLVRDVRSGRRETDGPARGFSSIAHRAAAHREALAHPY